MGLLVQPVVNMTARAAPLARVVANTHSVEKIAIKSQGLIPPKNEKIKSLRFSDLSWERVNEITWKLTDGQQCETPRCHGKWPGFRTSLALGWVMNIGGDVWVGRFARRGKRYSSGNATLDGAKWWLKNAVTGRSATSAESNRRLGDQGAQ